MYLPTLLALLTLSFSISASVIPLESRSDLVSLRNAFPNTIDTPYEDNFADKRAVGTTATAAIVDCLTA